MKIAVVTLAVLVSTAHALPLSYHVKRGSLPGEGGAGTMAKSETPALPNPAAPLQTGSEPPNMANAPSMQPKPPLQQSPNLKQSTSTPNIVPPTSGFGASSQVKSGGSVGGAVAAPNQPPGSHPSTSSSQGSPASSDLNFAGLSQVHQAPPADTPPKVTTPNTPKSAEPVAPPKKPMASKPPAAHVDQNSETNTLFGSTHTGANIAAPKTPKKDVGESGTSIAGSDAGWPGSNKAKSSATKSFDNSEEGGTVFGGSEKGTKENSDQTKTKEAPTIGQPVSSSKGSNDEEANGGKNSNKGSAYPGSTNKTNPSTEGKKGIHSSKSSGDGPPDLPSGREIPSLKHAGKLPKGAGLKSTNTTDDGSGSGSDTDKDTPSDSFPGGDNADADKSHGADANIDKDKSAGPSIPNASTPEGSTRDNSTSPDAPITSTPDASTPDTSSDSSTPDTDPTADTGSGPPTSDRSGKDSSIPSGDEETPSSTSGSPLDLNGLGSGSGTAPDLSGSTPNTTGLGSTPDTASSDLPDLGTSDPAADGMGSSSIPDASSSESLPDSSSLPDPSSLSETPPTNESSLPGMNDTSTTGALPDMATDDNSTLPDATDALDNSTAAATDDTTDDSTDGSSDSTCDLFCTFWEDKSGCTKTCKAVLRGLKEAQSSTDPESLSSLNGTDYNPMSGLGDLPSDNSTSINNGSSEALKNIHDPEDSSGAGKLTADSDPSKLTDADNSTDTSGLGGTNSTDLMGTPDSLNSTADLTNTPNGTGDPVDSSGDSCDLLCEFWQDKSGCMKTCQAMVAGLKEAKDEKSTGDDSGNDPSDLSASSGLGASSPGVSTGDKDPSVDSSDDPSTLDDLTDKNPSDDGLGDNTDDSKDDTSDVTKLPDDGKGKKKGKKGKQGKKGKKGKKAKKVEDQAGAEGAPESDSYW